jgi:hypothetical protein
MTQTEFIKTFESFPVKDRIAIARQLKSKVLDDLFEELDAQMPDIEMSISEIQAEIQADRDEQRKKAETRSGR